MRRDTAGRCPEDGPGILCCDRSRGHYHFDDDDGYDLPFRVWGEYNLDDHGLTPGGAIDRLRPRLKDLLTYYKLTPDQIITGVTEMLRDLASPEHGGPSA